MNSKEVKDIICSAKKVAIFGHMNPDLDCFGAMFGAKFLCKKLNCEAHLFSDVRDDSFLLKIFDKSVIEKNFVQDDFDLVILVDLNDFSRIAPIFRDKVKNCPNILVIDHHGQSVIEKGCKFYIHSEISAASLIFVDLIFEFGFVPTKQVATYLFAGIVGDTGRFLHTNTDTHTLLRAVDLMNLGVDIQKVYDVVYRSKTLSQIAVQRFLLDNMNIVNGNLCYIVISNSDLQKLKASVEDIKLFMDDLNQIGEFKAVMVAYELDEKEYKVSCRSKYGFSVAEIAVKHGGGGHKMAAGFDLQGTKQEVMKKLKEICEENKWQKAELFL